MASQGRQLNNHATTKGIGVVMDSKQLKIVYVVTEKGDRSFWTRIGVAYPNRDGSLNVKLEAIPLQGHMQIRDYTPREETAGSGAGARGGSQRFDELTSGICS